MAKAKLKLTRMATRCTGWCRTWRSSETSKRVSARDEGRPPLRPLAARPRRLPLHLAGCQHPYVAAATHAWSMLLEAIRKWQPGKRLLSSPYTSPLHGPHGFGQDAGRSEEPEMSRPPKALNDLDTLVYAIEHKTMAFQAETPGLTAARASALILR